MDDDKSIYPPDTMGHKSCPKAKELQRAIEEILEKHPSKNRGTLLKSTYFPGIIIGISGIAEPPSCSKVGRSWGDVITSAP